MLHAAGGFLVRNEERSPAQVADSWQRLEKWYASHIPELLCSLRPGVSEDQLREFQAAKEVILPQDVKESLRIHDGQDKYFHPGAVLGMQLLSLTEIEKELEWGRKDFRIEAESDVSWFKIEFTSFPSDAIRRQFTDPFWIPLAGGEGVSVGIDLDPAVNGRREQVINFGHLQEHKFVLAVSWAHFLEDMADELERGTIKAIRDEDGSIHFSHARPQEQGIWWYYRTWSEAKLPAAFQRQPPVESAIEIPGSVIHDELARAGRVIVERFVSEMHAYERRWLEVRPIQELGMSYVSENPTGHHAIPIPSNIMESATAMPTREEMTETMEHMRESIHNTVSEHGSIEKAMNAGGFANVFTRCLPPRFREREERMQWGKYRKEAVAEWNAIVGRYCTPRKREQSETFVQSYPLRYDPSRDCVAEVRQVSPEHLTVYLQPDGSKVTRFHLLRHEGRWLIDLKEETTDCIRYRKVSV